MKINTLTTGTLLIEKRNQINRLGIIKNKNEKQKVANNLMDIEKELSSRR